MKILLTNPPRSSDFGHCLVQPDWPNLSLPYIAAIYKNDEVRIVDNGHGYEYNNLEETIAEFMPDVVGWSIRAQRELPKALEQIRNIKVHQIAGGQGAFYNQDELKEAGVSEIIQKADAHIKNIDDNPIPRWDLINKIPSYFFKGRFTGSLETSRGCPFKCDFCSVSVYWGEFRQKSNDRIIEELQVLCKDGRSHIYLGDDSFGLGTNKHMELFDKIISKNIDIKFFTQIRADTIAKNPEMVKMAKKAGLYGVLIGFDTYEDLFLKDKKSSELNIAASNVLRENDIAIYGCHIYGLPSQSKPKDFERTFQMGRKYSDLFTMPFFTPFKNTVSAVNAPERGKDWKKQYSIYQFRHQFSPSEILGALFHPNPVIRKLKQGGFKKYINYYLT